MIALKISFALVLLGFSASQPIGYGVPMVVTYTQPIAYAQPAYAQPAYAAPSYAAPYYDVHDVTKIVDYDHSVNDYYGNEQGRQEHVEPGKQIGSSMTRMADGAMQSVTYEAGSYGNLAHVVVRNDAYTAPVHSYAAPVHTYSAPAYSAPAYSAPAYSAPAYSAPAYSAPGYTSPAHTYAVPMLSY